MFNSDKVSATMCATCGNPDANFTTVLRKVWRSGLRKRAMSVS